MNGRPTLSYERYSSGSGDWIMRIGEPAGMPVLFVPPLFEELNRTRAFLSSLMRSLAELGFDCWLPDLPGTGESEAPLEDVRWDDWRSSVRAAALHVTRAAEASPTLASLRGGALLDDASDARCIWRLAPADGASLARDLERSSLMSGTSYAGYKIAPGLLNALKASSPAAAPDAQLRVVRLESDRGEANAKLPGPTLWRRSEPGNAPDLARAAAADLARFVGSCADS